MKSEGKDTEKERKRTDAEIFVAAFKIENIRALLKRLEKHDVSLSPKEIADKNHRALMAYFGLNEKEHGDTLKFFGLPYDVDKDLDINIDTVNNEELSRERRERDDSVSLVKLYDKLSKHDAKLSEKEIADKNHRTLLKYFGLSEKEDGAMLRLFGLPYDIGEDPGSADGINDIKIDQTNIDSETVVPKDEENSFMTLFRKLDENDVNLSDKKIAERNHRLIMKYFGLNEKEDGAMLKLFGLPYNVDQLKRTDEEATNIIRKFNDEVECSAIQNRPNLSTLLKLLETHHPESSENEIADKNHRMMMTYFDLNDKDHGSMLKLFGLKFSTSDENSENNNNNDNSEKNKNNKKSTKMFPFLDSDTNDVTLTDSRRRLDILEKRKAELVWEANKDKAQNAFQYVAKSVTKKIAEFVPKKADIDSEISIEKNINNMDDEKKNEGGSDRKEDRKEDIKDDIKEEKP